MNLKNAQNMQDFSPWNTCGRILHEGNMLTLINQAATYITYLNIHIATLRNVNLNNKYNNLHLALVTRPDNPLR